jgi:hypothetical protein
MHYDEMVFGITLWTVVAVVGGEFLDMARRAKSMVSSSIAHRITRWIAVTALARHSYPTNWGYTLGRVVT